MERDVEREGIFPSMKKMMVIGALLLCSAVGYAQESRQDVSLSGFAPLAPDVRGNGVNPMHTTITTGFLGSYRYMVTPRSGQGLAAASTTTVRPGRC